MAFLFLSQHKDTPPTSEIFVFGFSVSDGMAVLSCVWEAEALFCLLAIIHRAFVA